ncbi:MAG: aldehyde dehydrogenase (NADP(+)), partial [Acidobacteria bacterium]|nr:aldehyde dehydrogenase (NADP(+)) [Acidobacteriota bacterium]
LLVSPGAHDLYRVSGVLGVCSAGQFLENPNWQEEVFGPFSLVVRCQDRSELKRVLDTLKGQLTATFWADPAELANYSECIGVMRQRAGRLLFNGVPTGVEVCHAMQHGGPYPASTDARFTSVGSSALRRWIQPQCFQNWPHEALPPALQNQNPLGIWRTINGEMTQAPL